MTNLNNYKKAQHESTELDRGYKDLLTKYALLLLTAELAVIGFLLQNNTTGQLLKSPFLKAYFLISITFSLAAILLNFIYKIFERLYAKYETESRFFKAIPGVPLDMFGNMITIPQNPKSAELSTAAMLKAIKASKKLKPILRLTEIALALAATFGVIFVYTLVIKL